MLSSKKAVKGVYSPLYHLISKLVEEGADCFNGVTPEKIENEIRSAYAISVRSAIEKHLFEEQGELKDFLFDERHFSFDKVYKKNENLQHGLTAVHYTETYYSRQRNQYIVVHAYLNRDGRYLYLQVRRLDSDKKIVVENLNIDSALEQSVQVNMNQNTCRETLSFLLEERRLRYCELKEKSDCLDNELGILFNKIVDNGIEEYIEKVNVFVCAVNDLNAYSDERDYRAEFFLNQLQEIKAWENRLKKSSIVVKTASSSSKAHVADVQKNVAQTEVESFMIESQDKIQDKMIQGIIEELERVEASLKKDKAETIPALLEKMSGIDKANRLSLMLFSAPQKMLHSREFLKKRNNTSLNLVEKTQTCYEEWLSFLKKAVSNGELDEVRKLCALFPIFKPKLKEDFYEWLIRMVLDCKNKEFEKKLGSICDYFNESSEEYRNCVFNFSQEQKFLICEKDIQKVSKLFRFDVNASLLYKLYFDGKKDLFSMFLQHGADANVWGIRGVKQKEAPFSLIYVIGAFEQEKRGYLDYLEILLKYNANGSQIYTTEKLRSMRHARFKARQEVTKTNKMLAKNSGENNNNNLRLDVVSTEIRLPLLHLLACRNNLNVCKLLLPSSSLEDVAYTFSCFANDKKIRNRLVPSTMGPSIVFAENASELTNKTNSFQQKSFELPFFIFGFYPAEEGDNSNRTYFETLKALDVAFKQKTELMDKEEFENGYKKIFNLGKERVLQEKSVEALHAFYACQYLLVERSQKLRREEKLYLMRDKIPVLNLLMIQLIRGLYKGTQFLDYYVKIYTGQMNACKNTKAHAEWANGSVISILNDASANTHFPACSIQNLSYSLGALLANNAFFLGFVMVEEPQLFFFKDKEEYDLVVEKIEEDNNKSRCNTPFFTFFLYPNEENVGNIGTSSDVYVDNVNIIYNALSKRILALDNKNFKNEYDLLFAFGCISLSKRFISEAQSALQGCEYLLIERCKGLDKDDRLKLMKDYGVELNKKIISMYQLKYNKSEEFEILKEILKKYLARAEGFKIEFDCDERNAINDGGECLRQAGQFLTSPDVNEKLKQIVVRGKDRLESVLNRLYCHRKDGDYSEDQFSNLKSFTRNLSRCMVFGYDHARAMTYADAPDRRDYALSGKAIQFQQLLQWEKWKKEVMVMEPGGILKKKN